MVGSRLYYEVGIKVLDRGVSKGVAEVLPPKVLPQLSHGCCLSVYLRTHTHTHTHALLPQRPNTHSAASASTFGVYDMYM